MPLCKGCGQELPAAAVAAKRRCCNDMCAKKAMRKSSSPWFHERFLSPIEKQNEEIGIRDFVPFRGGRKWRQE